MGVSAARSIRLSAPGGMAWLALALAPMFQVVGGCNVPGARAWNLRAVHRPDGSVARRGEVVGDIEFLVRSALQGMDAGEFGQQAEGGELIADPLGVCLENLIQLENCDGDDPAVLGLQVELFAWLAVDDAYVLGRERSVLALASAAGRLGAPGALLLPQGAVPAGPTDVGAAILALVRSVRSVVQPVGVEEAEEGSATTGSLAEACHSASLLVLDRQGARRLLAACNAIAGPLTGNAAGRSALDELRTATAIRCVWLAMGEALSDGSPVVRAAAVEACVLATDNGLPSVVRLALEDPSTLVVERGLDLIREFGLPGGNRVLTEVEQRAVSDAWRRLLLRRTKDTRGAVSPSACRALSAVEPDGPGSLRMEEWTAWAVEVGITPRPGVETP